MSVAARLARIRKIDFTVPTRESNRLAGLALDLVGLGLSDRETIARLRADSQRCDLEGAVKILREGDCYGPAARAADLLAEALSNEIAMERRQTHNNAQSAALAGMVNGKNSIVN